MEFEDLLANALRRIKPRSDLQDCGLRLVTFSFVLDEDVEMAEAAELFAQNIAKRTRFAVGSVVSACLINGTECTAQISIHDTLNLV